MGNLEIILSKTRYIMRSPARLRCHNSLTRATGITQQETCESVAAEGRLRGIGSCLRAAKVKRRAVSIDRRVLLPRMGIDRVRKDGVAPRSAAVFAGIIRREQFALLRKTLVHPDGHSSVRNRYRACQREIIELSGLVGWLGPKRQNIFCHRAKCRRIDLVAGKLRPAGDTVHDFCR